ncbi:MAG: hypothetical protein QM709_01215 [Spongiibacteraceae bacterium]
MQRNMKRWCGLAVIAAMLNTAACGYLIFPERQGIRGDRVDGTVVALDAIGLLFFILPGVIAFAVDFSTGCIYLPQGHDGAFSMNTRTNFHVAPDEWVKVAQVAPFPDDATIAAALQNYLQISDRNLSSARIEWQPASVFSTPTLAASGLSETRQAH